MKPVVDERFASRSEAVARLPRVDPFDAALAVARAGRGLTFIAMRAPIVAPSVFVRAFPEDALAVWTAPDLTIVGVGIAHELRGAGPDRWQQVLAAARALAVNGAVICDRSRERPSATRIASRADWSIASPSTLLPVGELGRARPRLLGGAAFAPGAASSGPWAGFGDAWFALPRWTYVATDAEAWLTLAVDERDARDAERWPAELAIHEELPHRDRSDDAPAVIDVVRASAELWRAQVEAITSAIDAGDCSKIVAARTCTVTLDSVEAAPAQAAVVPTAGPVVMPTQTTVSSLLASRGLPAAPVRDASRVSSAAASLLDALNARQPECVRLLVRPPNAGALVAATPERLVRRDGDTIRCDALAGTIRHGGDPAAATALLSSAKDRREHDLVVRAIREALDGIDASIDAPAEPQIRTLRHVLHLHTPFRATASPCPHVLELAARLHPTPAVGGTPTPFAIDWIREHEPVPRGWYASPVGWFDLDGDGEFAVAIRSGVVVGNRVHLWAGAGIVAGSDPDRELAETELKLRAMLGALGVA